MLAHSSAAWMFPPAQKPGLSLPVADCVTTATQMSRPSWLLPIDSTETSPG